MRIHRTILLTVLIMLLVSPAWAMERYVNIVQDRQGNALPGTQITVYQAGTTILADLFSDNNGTVKSNPFFNNANGSYDFLAANQVYDLHFFRSGTDFTTANSSYQRISLFDKNDSELDALPGSWPSNLTDPAVTSESSPLKIRGTGAQLNDGWNLYMHTNGKPIIACVNGGVEGDCNVETIVDAGNFWALYDSSNNLVVKIEPDASGMRNKYTFGSLYRPVKTIYWDAGSLNTDGSNCGTPTEQSLNFDEKTWAFPCADSNSSIFGGKVRMPAAWDGQPTTFTLSLFHATTETITFAGKFSSRCRGAGDTINSTYGTAVAANVAITTANLLAEATSAAVTPDGSCAGGKFLKWKYVVDAANFSTNAANSKVLGVSMDYAVTSWSN